MSGVITSAWNPPILAPLPGGCPNIDKDSLSLEMGQGVLKLDRASESPCRFDKTYIDARPLRVSDPENQRF